MDTDSSCRTVKKETAAVNCISTPATCRTSCIITNYNSLECEAEMYWQNIQIFTFTFRSNMQQPGQITKFAGKLFSLNSNLLQTLNFLITNLLRKKSYLKYFRDFQFHQCNVWILLLYKMRGRNRPANKCTSAVYAHELKRNISFIQ